VDRTAAAYHGGIPCESTDCGAAGIRSLAGADCAITGLVTLPSGQALSCCYPHGLLLANSPNAILRRGIIMSLSYILYIIGAIVVIVVILKVLGLY
jgi:hypothetical protein